MDNEPHHAVSLQAGRIRFDRRARTVLVDGRPAKLGGRAFDLLEALMQRRDRVVPKQELLDVVWPGLIVEENNLHVHVMALRKLLGSESIVTVSGRGYRFMLEEDAAADVDVLVLSSRSVGVAGEAAPPVGTSLVGRDKLIASTCALLRRDRVRLVTLRGPGGSGKTRLALRITAELAQGFADGSYIVMLAPVRDPARVASAVAGVLGVQESGARAIEDLLVAYLRDRTVLLTLDNFEHVQPAAPLLVRLLENCPGLKVLVTSRAVLRVACEQNVLVPPLALPAPHAGGAEALQTPAVRLLSDRARAVGRTLGGHPSDIPAVVDICRRLDGLPLAIELAAARLRVLTPVALAERLGRRLAILKTEADEVPQRQRTLRNAIAWSYALLNGDEQTLFRRLAVFVGGWTLDAAEAIARESKSGQSVLDVLTSLIDNSLVQRVEDVADEPRFAMLETVREFALELLESSSDAELLRVRHAYYFIAFVETLEPRLRSGNRASCLLRLGADYNNLRAALSRVVIEKPDAAAALRLTAALLWYWYFAAHFSEGRGWVRLALELPGADAATVARAKVLSGVARLAFYSGAQQEAVNRASESVALFRDTADRSGLAFALFHLGLARILTSERSTIFACFSEAEQLFSALGDEWGAVLALSYRAIAMFVHSDCEEQMRTLLNDALSRGRALGDVWLTTPTSHYLADLALRDGDLEAAREFSEEALGSSRELGDNYRVSRGLHQLAEIAFAAGEHEEALRHSQTSIALCQDQGRTGDIAVSLRQIAKIKAAQSRPLEAVRLYGAASRLEMHPITMPPDDAAEHERQRQRLRATMGSRRYESEWARGTSMSVEQAVTAATARTAV